MGKIILVVLFIPVFIGFLVLTSSRFQFLDSKFWISVLQKPGFYEQVVSVLKKGASTSEDMALVSIIAKDETKSALELNLKNLFDFANGKEKEFFLDIPKGLPIEAGRISVDQLNSLFPGMSSVLDPKSLQQLSLAGRNVSIAWVTAFATLVGILILMYFLTNAGARFVPVGIAFVVGGIFSLLIIGVLTVIRINWTKDLATSVNPGDALLGTLAPPVLEKMLGLWIYIAVGAVILGIVFFFFKKPKKKQKVS